ncbi:MAG: hypothetical protein MUP97_10830, partial [Acidimicrobiia bacterium]|nr:hypothetical protein [Acidimicrobiia bacterium]
GAGHWCSSVSAVAVVELARTPRRFRSPRSGVASGSAVGRHSAYGRHLNEVIAKRLGIVP